MGSSMAPSQLTLRGQTQGRQYFKALISHKGA